MKKRSKKFPAKPEKAEWPKVLVVCPKKLTLEGLKSLLFDWGYDVHDATNYEAGLERLKSVPNIKVAIIWHLLPYQDGLALANRIRRNYREVKVVLIGDKEIRSAAEAKKLIFLPRPYNSQQLRLALRELLPIISDF